MGNSNLTFANRKPLIVGQALPRMKMPSPLYPLPNSAGSRLAKFMDLSHEEYLRIFERINVVEAFPGRNSCGEDIFPAKKARENAEILLKEGFLENRIVVFLGEGDFWSVWSQGRLL